MKLLNIHCQFSKFQPFCFNNGRFQTLLRESVTCAVKSKKLSSIFQMGKEPQGRRKFKKVLYHRNQREKVPVGSEIHPNWSHNSSGKYVLKFSSMKNQEP